MFTSIVRRTLMLLIAKLGGCGRCMRQSLLVASGSWLLALPASLVLPWAWLWPLPAALSALWLLHIASFAVKNWRAGARRHAVVAPTRALPRRQLLAFALRAAAAAIVVSFTLPRLASAQGECDGGWHVCTDGRHCCPDGMNFLCLYDDCKNTPNRCYRAVTDEDYKYLQSCCQGLLNC